MRNRRSECRCKIMAPNGVRMIRMGYDYLQLQMLVPRLPESISTSNTCSRHTKLQKYPGKAKIIIINLRVT
jgi:hypothetical protein